MAEENTTPKIESKTVGCPEKLQPLEYHTPRPIKRVSALRYVMATIVAMLSVPFLWYILGVLVEKLVPRPEPQPLTAILLIVAAILSVTFGVIVFRGITQEPLKINA